MAQIGKYNSLRVIKEVDFGVYLDGEKNGEILMPIRYVPKDCKVGDYVDVFLYLDSEDRPVATTEKPFAQVGEFAMLRVISVNKIGTFLDWGIMKDLLVPFREQKVTMVENRSYLVYIYVDEESQRIVASAKLGKFLDKTAPEYAVGEEVELIIESETDLGYKAIINNQHWGILYENEVFEQLAKGLKIKGYIKKIRTDNKIDLSLHPLGYEKVDPLTQMILDELNKAGGFIAVSDKSDAEEVYRIFGISKKSFKQAIGALYKKRIISIKPEGIRLI
ncbi:MAG: S1-like domain-containing RNA-binding protein [Bacteroidia bacterium]|nr:S1-like domain-containing RNA-binding protein [Bacteroidia bacterium]